MFAEYGVRHTELYYSRKSLQLTSLYTMSTYSYQYQSSDYLIFFIAGSET